MSPSSRSNYTWEGLMPGVTYYVRINQQVGNQWRPSPIYELRTPCTGQPAPANATFKVVAFADQFVQRGGGLPSVFTPEGGTMTSCPQRIVIYVELTGLDNPQEVTVSWTGPSMDRSVQFVIPANNPLEPFGWVAPQGGYKDGKYTFRLLTGAGTNATVLIEGNMALICNQGQ